MKRFALILGAWVLFPLMAYAASHAALPLPDIVTHHVPFVLPFAQFIVTTAAFVGAFFAFDLVYHGYRQSLFRLIGANLLSRVRTRTYVARSLDPLAEVQRTGRGTVGISSV